MRSSSLHRLRSAVDGLSICSTRTASTFIG
jgi:hypothetical protein